MVETPSFLGNNRRDRPVLRSVGAGRMASSYSPTGRGGPLWTVLSYGLADSYWTASML